MLTDRLPPHDIKAEDAVIGSLVIDGAATVKAAAILKPEDFYRERNAWAFEAAIAVMNRGEIVDQLTLAHELEAHGRLADMGGSSYLSHLVATTPTSVHLVHYAGIVQRLARLRNGLTAAHDLARMSYDLTTAPDTLGRQFIEAGLTVLDGAPDKALRPLKEFIDEDFNDLVALFEGGAEAVGLRTGLDDLDRKLGALRPGKLYVAGGRTSMGKTQFLIELVMNVARRGVTVVHYSLEESSQDITARLVGSLMGVDWTRLEPAKRLTRHAEFLEAVGTVSDLPIFTTSAARLTAGEMLAQVTVEVARGRVVGLVVVDYLNLVDDDGNAQQEARATVVDRIALNLKRLARELQVPVIAAAQLNREPEHRASHEPTLADLRESGGIEQTADAVLLLYRPWYYVERGMATPADVRPKGFEGDDRKLANLLRVNIAKHRGIGGVIGPVDLFYNPEQGRVRCFTR